MMAIKSSGRACLLLTSIFCLPGRLCLAFLPSANLHLLTRVPGVLPVPSAPDFILPVPSKTSVFSSARGSSSSVSVQDLSPSYTSVQRPKDVVPRTMQNAIEVFFLQQYNGPRIVAAILATFSAWRLCLPGGLTVADASVLVASVVFWWFQEHFLHKHLLHSEKDWYGKEIHNEHHANPYYHVSIDPAPLMLAWMGSVHVILRLVLPLPLALTATLGYCLSGLFYEWSHFIAHTKVRFRRGSIWQQIKDHHRKHHVVDPDHWLAFSFIPIDTLFGTNPDVREHQRKLRALKEKPFD